MLMYKIKVKTTLYQLDSQINMTIERTVKARRRKNFSNQSHEIKTTEIKIPNLFEKKWKQKSEKTIKYLVVISQKLRCSKMTN